ncbi:hypothetical protein ANCCAN_07936 [Ancylostoma caninum]|uniref:Uncharacterized protein n=1 Tax=Ancylostoma caninum TaxID=29170 RepID=A0A368GSQ7_ANCCA|nr:hypothetical protein ANCCAN_07936 [Ancylostoma caninum]
MFGCITHQPRRNRPRNFEDEPPNLRSRSFDTPDGAESPPIAPKRTGRHSSLPAKSADSLKGSANATSECKSIARQIRVMASKFVTNLIKNVVESLPVMIRILVCDWSCSLQWMCYYS